MGIKFNLIEQDNRPAVEFEDGDIIYQDEPLADFLMHIDILMPDMPDELEIVRGVKDDTSTSKSKK